MKKELSISKSQIDRLGNRLREGDFSESDLRLLDRYRRSFISAYDYVVFELRSLGLETTGRPAKSTASIRAKLQRESIRLSQMQDIAGCRIVVKDAITQAYTLSDIEGAFSELIIVDRRKNPSHSYRAVHIMVSAFERVIEIQLRTLLQHLWAELSEKLADAFDYSIKYGGGDDKFRTLLNSGAEAIADIEKLELKASDLAQRMTEYHRTPEDMRMELQDTQDQIRDQKQGLEMLLRKMISDFKGLSRS